jgi:hypothetical protein
MAEAPSGPPLLRAAAITLAAAPALAACAISADNAPAPRPADTCRADAAQRFLGQRASAENGAAIMAATRSRSLRWIAPDMIVTTEYAFGRVTVGYNEKHQIMEVTCG